MERRSIVYWNIVPFPSRPEMRRQSQRTERRTDALSKERIVDAAIHILDTEGEAALTFRALATHLATGSGAIYWHLPDKGELLAAAADDVIADALASVTRKAAPSAAIRAIARALFDAIDARPWVGAQLSREPWRPAVVRIYEAVGEPIQAMGVPARAQFNAVSALVNYILGVAGQNASNARLLPRGTDRKAYLAAVAERWRDENPEVYPFVHQVATQLRDHDDREQFLAGVDLILAGIGTVAKKRSAR